MLQNLEFLNADMMLQVENSTGGHHNQKSKGTKILYKLASGYLYKEYMNHILDLGLIPKTTHYMQMIKM